MPKRQPPKNSTWVQLTKDFVSEWPEILEGLQFQNMPVKYLLYVNIILKNNVTIHYDISKELKLKKQERIAKFLKDTFVVFASCSCRVHVVFMFSVSVVFV